MTKHSYCDGIDMVNVHTKKLWNFYSNWMVTNQGMWRYIPIEPSICKRKRCTVNQKEEEKEGETSFMFWVGTRKYPKHMGFVPKGKASYPKLKELIGWESHLWPKRLCFWNVQSSNLLQKMNANDGDTYKSRVETKQAVEPHVHQLIVVLTMQQ